MFLFILEGSGFGGDEPVWSKNFWVPAGFLIVEWRRERAEILFQNFVVVCDCETRGTLLLLWGRNFGTDMVQLMWRRRQDNLRLHKVLNTQILRAQLLEELAFPNETAPTYNKTVFIILKGHRLRDDLRNHSSRQGKGRTGVRKQTSPSVRAAGLRVVPPSVVGSAVAVSVVVLVLIVDVAAIEAVEGDRPIRERA